MAKTPQNINTFILGINVRVHCWIDLAAAPYMPSPPTGIHNDSLRHWTSERSDLIVLQDHYQFTSSLQHTKAQTEK